MNRVLLHRFALRRAEQRQGATARLEGHVARVERVRVVVLAVLERLRGTDLLLATCTGHGRALGLATRRARRLLRLLFGLALEEARELVELRLCGVVCLWLLGSLVTALQAQLHQRGTGERRARHAHAGDGAPGASKHEQRGAPTISRDTTVRDDARVRPIPGDRARAAA